jgi:hypothetical protein
LEKTRIRNHFHLILLASFTFFHKLLNVKLPWPIEVRGDNLVCFVEMHITSGGGSMPILKSLLHKRRSMPQIDAIFKYNDIIPNSPRLALLANNNVLVKLTCQRIHYVVDEEFLYQAS